MRRQEIIARTAAVRAARDASRLQTRQGVHVYCFDGAGGRVGEVEGEFDLVAVFGGEEGEDYKADNGAGFVGRVVVLAMLNVLPGMDVRQVDVLMVLSASQPILDAFVDFPPKLRRDIVAHHDIMHFDALLLCVADLALNVVVRGRLEGFLEVDALFGGAGEAAPIEAVAEGVGGVGAAEDPEGFHVRFVLDPVEVAGDDFVVLAFVAEGVANGHGVALVWDVADGGAGLVVPPDFEFGLEPGCVGGVAVVGD